MSYVVLARRYRPQLFKDLVGQEHVSLTLKNALKLDRTAHAYLFTGPRGVGKTSAARLLAKALRCLNPQEDFEPCNNCVACEGVNSGSSLDVIEIDAASNTGVDNIRELRDNVGFMASIGKYRIYIIDEVHMLSTAAFNALLKTLEEPPPHVVFIFATTELHKVLPTIQSRCQRFDFKKINPQALATKIQEICKLENVSIDEASLKTLVFESEGCLRDAESLLDQAIALCGNNITIEVLEKTLGLVERSSFFELMNSLGDNNTGKSLKLCTEILNKGIDPKVLLSRILEFFRDLHYFCFVKEFSGDDNGWNDALKTLNEKWSQDQCIRALDLSIKSQSNFSNVISGHYAVESLVVKLSLQRPAITTNPSTEIKDSSMRNTTESSEDRKYYSPNNFVGATPAQNASAGTASAPNANANARNNSFAQNSSVNNSPGVNNYANITKNADSEFKSSHKDSSNDLTSNQLIDKLRKYLSENKPAWIAVLQSISSINIENDCLVAYAKNDFAGRRLASADGVELLKKAFGVKQARSELITPANDASANIKDPKVLAQEKRTMAKDHDAVKSAIKIFNAVVTETKILD